MPQRSLPDSPPLLHSSLSQISSLTHSLAGAIFHSFSHTPFDLILFPQTHLVTPSTLCFHLLLPLFPLTRFSLPLYASLLALPPLPTHSLGSASHSLRHSLFLLLSPLTHSVQISTLCVTLCSPSSPHSLGFAAHSVPHSLFLLPSPLTRLVQFPTRSITLLLSSSTPLVHPFPLYLTLLFPLTCFSPPLTPCTCLTHTHHIYVTSLFLLLVMSLRV